MGDKTSIEWTNATWNPVAGCTIVSPGCTNCYAMKMAARIEAMGSAPHYAGLTMKTKAGAVWTGKMSAAPESILTQPLRWKRPRRIFVNSMSDLFHEGVADETIDRVFAVMALCPHHTFQVLTKRAERVRAYFGGPSGNTSPTGFRCPRLNHILNVADRLSRRDHPAAFTALAATVQQIGKAGYFPNVWLGVSTEDQARAEERIRDLLATPAAVRFLSVEPMLGAVDLTAIVDHDSNCARAEVVGFQDYITNALTGEHGMLLDRGRHYFPRDNGAPKIDWVIAGGESGKGARPMHPDWVRSLRDQCAAAGVPFFFKQWGNWRPEIDRDRDDPDWRRDYGIVNRKPDHFTILNLEGGCGFHGERVHLMAKHAKAANDATLDGREHREFPT